MSDQSRYGHCQKCWIGCRSFLHRIALKHFTLGSVPNFGVELASFNFGPVTNFDWKLWSTWYYFTGTTLSKVSFGCNVSMVICTGCPYIHISRWLCARCFGLWSRLATKTDPSQLARRSAEIKCDLIPRIAN